MPEDKKYAVSILIEYIRSLTDNKITIEHFLFELLINCLVINKMYFQLHQMVQYHIIMDSKPLVILKCIFLSDIVESISVTKKKKKKLNFKNIYNYLTLCY